MNKALKIPKNCTGCSACVSVCPCGAIEMKKDADGFFYPQIEKNKCVDCGKCASVCPETNKISAAAEKTAAYAAFSNDDFIRKDSSSGGVFNQLADKILEEGGVVYGAAFSEDFCTVKHTAVTVKEEMYKLRGSKYLQSRMNDTFLSVKKDLIKQKKVLFSGTPCQAAGLKAFLGKEYPNLVVVDFICHGVPSEKVWQKYLSEAQNRFSSPVKDADFRDKESGWKKFSLSLRFSNGSSTSEKVTESPYMRGFVSNLYLRKSCYDCKFKGSYYQSDITLADFWGVERLFPDLNDDKGISLVIVHSEKGEALFGEADIVKRQVSLKDAVCENPSYFETSHLNFNRKPFFKSLDKADNIGKYIEEIRSRKSFGNRLYRYYKRLIKIMKGAKK